MYQSNTRDEVLEYLAFLTEKYDGENDTPYTAQSISDFLSISRNLASQYLNDFVKESLAIKIISRPVYFIHKRTFEKKYRIKLNMVVFKSKTDLLEILRSHDMVRLGFGRAAGFYGSLRECVEQCKAAMGYPPSGLPILLFGGPGVGKSFMVRQMYEYAQGKGYIGEESRLVTINCSEFAECEKAFWERMFSQKEDGFLEQAKGGVLFFDQIHLLPARVQSRLFGRLEAGNGMGGGRSSWAPCKTAFASNVDPKGTLDRDFLRRIPFIVRIPSLGERSIQEKIELIQNFLDDEMHKIGIDITISRPALNAFLQYEYSENLTQLKGMIQISCAKAYLHYTKRDRELLIKLFHLPEQMVEEYRLENESDEEEAAVSLGALSEQASARNKEFFSLLLEGYRNYKEQEGDFTDLTAAWSKTLYESEGLFLFGGSYQNQHTQAINKMVEHGLDSICSLYQIQLPADMLALLVRVICNSMQTDTDMWQWEQIHEKELQECLQFLKEARPDVHGIAAEAAAVLNRRLNVSLDRVCLLALNICICVVNADKAVNKTSCVILAHGYTAGSIAQTVNGWLKTFLFVPMDIPADTPVTETAERIKRYLRTQQHVKNLILMIDMDMLEALDELILQERKLNLVMISDITTGLALELGKGILEGRKAECVLKELCGRRAFSYRVIPRLQLADTVVFVEKNDTGVAKRMIRLFRDSLPKNSDVEVISCDFDSAVAERQNRELFQNRNVLFVSGVFNPGISGAPFIPIEKIINLMDEKDIRQMFSENMDAMQLEEFARNLLKNFSLQNVVKHLTILDADKLLEFVQIAVNRLQHMMERQFAAKTIVGLYIHISCLIERLVTRTSEEDEEDSQVFQKEQEQFIRYVKESFVQICEHYHVELPTSEIKYIYDYIENENPEHSF